MRVGYILILAVAVLVVTVPTSVRADTATSAVHGESYNYGDKNLVLALHNGSFAYGNVLLYLYSFSNDSVVYNVSAGGAIVAYGNFTVSRVVSFNLTYAGLNRIVAVIGGDTYTFDVRALGVQTYDQYAGLSSVPAVYPYVNVLAAQLQAFLAVIVGISVAFVWVGWLPPFKMVSKLKQEVVRLV